MAFTQRLYQLSPPFFLGKEICSLSILVDRAYEELAYFIHTISGSIM